MRERPASPMRRLTPSLAPITPSGAGAAPPVASTVVSAALKADSIPERALLRAEEVDVFAPSAAVDAEFTEVLSRPKFARAIPLAQRDRFLRILRDAAIWFDPVVRVSDCRDPKDDKYL